MAKAHFTVQIPSEPHGLSEATHHYVAHGPLKTEHAHVVQAHPHHILHLYAEDIPESDSHVKQIAAYVGEIANSPAIFAAKSGKQGTQTWTIANHHHKA